MDSGSSTTIYNEMLDWKERIKCLLDSIEEELRAARTSRVDKFFYIQKKTEMELLEEKYNETIQRLTWISGAMRDVSIQVSQQMYEDCPWPEQCV